MLSFTVIATLFFLSCSISTSFTVILYFILKKQLQRRSSRLMFSMALADLLGASFWFADILDSVCPLTLVVNLYGYQAAQTWSCVMGAYLILKFTDKHIPPEVVFHLIAWGIPFIPQALILSMKLYSEHPPPQGCWFDFGQTEMVVVAIPQVLSVLVNTVFLSFICLNRRNASKTSRWGFTNRDKSLFFIQICCLVTTVSSILQSIPNAPDFVYTLSFCLGAAQGLFNTLSMRQTMVLRFFSWTNTKIRNSLRVTPNMFVPVNDGSGNRISVVVSPTSTNNDQEIADLKQDELLAPSSTLMVKPFSSYHPLPSSDV